MGKVRLLVVILCACGSTSTPVARQVAPPAAPDPGPAMPRFVANIDLGIARVVTDATAARIATIVSDGNGSNHGSLVVWSVPRGRELFRLADTLAVAFGPGDWLVSGDVEGHVAIRSASTGKLLRELGKLEKPIAWVGVEPDGLILASAEYRLVEWDPQGHQRRAWKSVTTIRGSVLDQSFALSRDGHTLASVTSEYTFADRYTTWSLRDAVPQPKTTELPTHGSVKGAALSSDGSRLAIESRTPKGDGALIVDVATGRVLRTIEGPETEILGFPDDNTLLTAGKRLESFTIDGGPAASSHVLPVEAEHGAIAGDATRVVIVAPDHIAVIRSDDAREVARLGHQDAVNAVAWSADGMRLATGGWSKAVALWDVAHGGAPALRDAGGHVAAITIAPDGRLAAMGLDTQDRLRAWRADGKQLFDAGMSVNCDALAFVGENLVDGDPNANSEAWNAYGASIDPPPDVELDHTTSVRAGDVRADADEQRVILRRRKDHEPVAILRHPVPVVGLAAHDTLLAAGRRDGVIELWDTRGFASLGQLAPPPGDDEATPRSIAFRPDGKVLAVGRSDGLTDLWDVPSHTRVAQLFAADDGRWFVLARDGHVEGKPGANAPLTWERAGQSLPAAALWQQQTRSALLPAALAAAPPPVEVVPQQPPPRATPACLADADSSMQLVRDKLVGGKLVTCHVRPPDDAWCFELDLATGAVVPVAADVSIQAATSKDPHPLPAPAITPTAFSDSALRAERVDDNHVDVFDVKSGKLRRRITIEEGDKVQELGFLGRTLVVTDLPCAGPCATSVLYDVRTGRRLGALGGDEHPANTYDVTPMNLHDNVYAFQGDFDGGVIVVQDAGTGRVLANLTERALGLPEDHYLQYDLLPSGDGGMFVVGDRTNSGRIWQIDRAGKVIRGWHLPGC
jgi:WD40 repeat protein